MRPERERAGSERRLLAGTARHPEIVRVLLAAGAWTPVFRDQAAAGRSSRRRRPGVRRTISLLALAGADPDAPDGEGHTPGGLYWQRMVGPNPTGSG